MGCSNAAQISLAELTGVSTAEECKNECTAFGQACEAAQFESGWIAWGDGQPTGGFEFTQTTKMQQLLAQTCKVSPCGDASLGQTQYVPKAGFHPGFCVMKTSNVCSNPGQDQCPDDEFCVSLGGSACSSNIGTHTAKSCGTGTNPQPPPSLLVMNTGGASVQSLPGGAKLGSCGGTQTHANSCFGPFQDSEEFIAAAGDLISWEYKATGSGDWFEVMVVVMKGDEPVHIPTYRFGDQLLNFMTDEWTIPEDGDNWKIRFIVGSYDASGLGGLGAQMQVKKFGRTDANGVPYKKCRLLGSGCSEVNIPCADNECGLSTRPDADPVRRRLGSLAEISK